MFEDIFQVQGFDEESEFMPLVPLGEDEESDNKAAVIGIANQGRYKPYFD